MSTKTFEEKMDYLRRFLFDVMRPSISEFLRWHDKEKHDEWQHNCCRQTSLITNWYLRKWLLTEEAGYEEIQSWVGEFTDILNGRPQAYDHAWIYCVHRSDVSKNLLIDIARHHKPLVFEFTTVNRFSKRWEGYEHMTCRRKVRLEEDAVWEQNEYYTGKSIKEMIPKLSAYMSRQGVMGQKSTQPKKDLCPA
jgi:hypothetical protein